ncbi:MULTISPECIES: membrane protein [Ralstonia solanacearum species complex]|uniref:Putative transmembrane protein n=3 Tax=Ralstonia solanacearum species complex TaxID=3116862 RepID=A0A0S4U5W9_RALSL|nr:MULTISPECIES: membrane protein [Ralstonia]AOE92034.1 hypothetical protein LBM341_03784 [Ralstonia solanacearum]ARS58703.1 hypothetical protein BC427_21415 [Ralstonia solanacearum FJAT-91]AST89148.1 hypothetical protein CIG66_22510 [Ralstonia pseudosolanacearum]AXV72317.1 hypothetical protein CJO74_24245 [Ralstonia solanacearum]AXV98814.1 hypothetical protein CJO80_25480 [Ralstonia solanacearum]
MTSAATHVCPPACPADPQPAAHPSRNVFVRHWRGDYSLVRSYWLHTALMQFGTVTLSAGITHALAHNAPARAASSALLLIYALGLVLWMWAIVGTWRAAEREQAEKRRAGLSGVWCKVAKLMILLGAIGTGSRVVNDLPRLGAHVRTALGEQAASPFAVTPQRDGRAVLFTGGINDGAADALEQALRKTPGATTVVLRSEGGWLREGTLVAAVIRRHRLHTYVERTCASACTIAFLAGDDRAAAPGARIGFHRPRAIGADQDQAPGATDSALWSAYAAAGLPDAFVRHVQATPFDAIWFPTDRELLDNGVVTRASSGGEYATMATLLTTREALSAELRAAPLYATLERKYPAHFKSLLDNIWPALQRHASDAEIIAQLRAQSSRLYRVLLPTAPDALLLANARLTIDQAQTLQRISPEACVGYLDGTAGPGTIAARLPGALLTREQALFSDLVQAADPEHAPMVTRAQAMPALQLAIAALPAQEQRVLTFPTLRHTAPAAARCRALIDFAQAILSLPDADRVLALRGIYAPTSAPDA